MRVSARTAYYHKGRREGTGRNRGMGDMADRHNQKWYVVQARPRQERRAEENLRRQGFEPFLPTVITTARRGRMFKNRVVPLFSGYLFVRFCADSDPWRQIFGTYGVTRLICAGERPIAVPQDLVDELLAGSAGLNRPIFGPGDRVRISSGPFAGLTAQLVQMSSAGRVRVLLSVLGGEIPLDLKYGVLGSAA